jgi:hypothetical protein
MAQWGNTDDAANSVSWAIEGLIANNGDPAATQTTLFGNTTPDAIITDQTVGQFGVDAQETTAALGDIPHAGWVLRTEGSGGRAGRIQHEVLVAMGSIGTDAEDEIMPDFGIVIDTQPADVSETAGNPITLTVVARSVPDGGTLAYKWERATAGAPTVFVEITGATVPDDNAGEGLTYSNFTTNALGIATTGSNAGADGYRYRVTVTETTGGTTAGVVSDVATISLSV